MPDITRRDFLNGVAAGAVAATTGGTALGASTAMPYPPKLTHMRGGNEMYRAAHALAWEGKEPPVLTEPTGGTFDMIIVGGGLSGLGAAWHYQRRNGFDKKVLIIDNHDDFGGHAQRNEFTVRGHDLICSGGSDSIVRYEEVWHDTAKEMIESIGFDIDELRAAFDWDFYPENNLTNGMFLNADAFGKNALTRHFLDFEDEEDLRAILTEMPIADETRQILFNIATSSEKWYMEDAVRITMGWLRTVSYLDFLRQNYGLNDEGADILRNALAGATGLGLDLIGADLAAVTGLPGFGGLVKSFGFQGSPDELYAYFLGAHFVDGNASVARMFMRSLRPEIVSPKGTDMASIVQAKVDYARLDEEGAPTRIRLKNTVLNVRQGKDAVDVTYTDRHGNVAMARGAHCILACWHQVIPHICPELGLEQKEALALQEKAPVAFVNVALNNWEPIAKSGFARVVAPGNFFDFVNLERPIRLGGYNIPENPADPAVVSMMAYPTPAAEPDMTARDMLKIGRHILYGYSFEDFEAEIRKTLTGIWGPFGFDPDTHIAGISVNRWGHGYSYVYGIFDDHAPMSEEGPHLTASQQFGRISIANCDARAHADVGDALREAHRAVEEQLAL